MCTDDDRGDFLLGSIIPFGIFASRNSIREVHSCVVRSSCTWFFGRNDHDMVKYIVSRQKQSNNRGPAVGFMDLYIEIHLTVWSTKDCAWRTRWISISIELSKVLMANASILAKSQAGRDLKKGNLTLCVM